MKTRKVRIKRKWYTADELWDSEKGQDRAIQRWIPQTAEAANVWCEHELPGVVIRVGSQHYIGTYVDLPKPKLTRNIRLNGRLCVAEVIQSGIHCDVCPVQRWAPISEQAAIELGPQTDSKTPRGIAEPIIKIDDQHYVGVYDQRHLHELLGYPSEEHSD